MFGGLLDCCNQIIYAMREPFLKETSVSIYDISYNQFKSNESIHA